MIKKGSKLYSIAYKKCPKCQEGDFYKNPVSFKLTKITETNGNCKVCGQSFELEPSFYYGAMYVSYALTVAIAVAVFVLAYAAGVSLLGIFGLIAFALVALTPFVLRLSRIIWINLFVHFDPDIEKKNG